MGQCVDQGAHDLALCVALGELPDASQDTDMPADPGGWKGHQCLCSCPQQVDRYLYIFLNILTTRNYYSSDYTCKSFIRMAYRISLALHVSHSNMK